MPDRIATWQRYRDIAAECRTRARAARSPKTRAGLEVFAWRYNEIAEAELKRAPQYLFRCPITRLLVHGFLAEEAPSDDPNSYTPVSCLTCGEMHLVNFKTGKTVGERHEDYGRNGPASLHRPNTTRGQVES
jgi:hypothetical protein